MKVVYVIRLVISVLAVGSLVYLPFCGDPGSLKLASAALLSLLLYLLWR